MLSGIIDKDLTGLKNMCMKKKRLHFISRFAVIWFCCGRKRMFEEIKFDTDQFHEFFYESLLKKGEL
jgi:hypothetical protein